MVKKVVLDDSASESESQHLSDGGDDFDSAPQALSKSAKAQAKHD